MKRHPVQIHRKAADELDHIYRFIAGGHPATARKFIAGLKKSVLELSRFPRRGALCRLAMPDADTPVRFIVHKGYLIFYQVVKETVQVLHISAPGQDWLALFL